MKLRDSQSSWSDGKSLRSRNSMKSAFSNPSGRSGNSQVDKELKKNIAYQRFKKKDKAKGLEDSEAINESKDILHKFKRAVSQVNVGIKITNAFKTTNKQDLTNTIANQGNSQNINPNLLQINYQ